LQSVTTDKKLVEQFPSLEKYVQQAISNTKAPVVGSGRMLAITDAELCKLMSPPCDKRKK